MRFEPGMRVLEVGSCEFDFLHRAHEAWPYVHFVGIDTRAPDAVDGDRMVERRQADARMADTFPPESFDAVVSLSAIEHIGLGHYGDPKDPDGDWIAITNIWRWLKPGGWFYFDVPYDPTGYRVLNTECRIYDDEALWKRFRVMWPGGVEWRGYVGSDDVHRLVDKPTAAHSRYWYVAQLWRKH